MIYLDANGSEVPRPAARRAMLAALAQPGNPNAVHAAGRAARRVLEDARATIAGLIGAPLAGLVFTGGGTEADALAIHALSQGRRVIVGATEHAAVLAAAGPGAVVLPVDAQGLADLDCLAALLIEEPPSLVCLMLANNETGTIQPIAAAAALCARHGALLHVDAAQACGRIPVSCRALGATSVAISAHKLGGPPGAGAVWIDPAHAPYPLIAGGGQERGWRGGTPPLPAIAGFAAAVAEARTDLAAGIGAGASAGLRDRIECGAMACGAAICSAAAPRLPNTTCLVLPGRPAETQVIALDLAGIAVSAGAACSSGKVSRSHVLAAMGLGAAAGEAIRVSLPWNATDADADAFLVAYRDFARRVRPRAG